MADHGSGEIFVAFSTAGQPAHDAPVDLDPLFAAAVEATEEAVVNALWSAGTTDGRDGRVAEALPHDEVLELLAAHGRLGRAHAAHVASIVASMQTAPRARATETRWWPSRTA